MGEHEAHGAGLVDLQKSDLGKAAVKPGNQVNSEKTAKAMRVQLRLEVLNCTFRFK